MTRKPKAEVELKKIHLFPSALTADEVQARLENCVEQWNAGNQNNHNRIMNLSTSFQQMAEGIAQLRQLWEQQLAQMQIMTAPTPTVRNDEPQPVAGLLVAPVTLASLAADLEKLRERIATLERGRDGPAER